MGRMMEKKRSRGDLNCSGGFVDGDRSGKSYSVLITTKTRIGKREPNGGKDVTGGNRQGC